jgi:ATP-binding cassette subfamily F protein 3
LALTSLTIKNIRKSFGADEILADVSLTVTDDMRLGLVGPNGAGKTTLLRIISGELSADAGSVHMAPGIAAGYLRQEADAGTSETVWQTMLRVFDSAFAMEARLRELEHDMEEAAAHPDQWRRVSAEYDRVTKAFEEAGGYGYKSAIRGVLSGLGLGEELYDQPCSTLSGGQRSRLGLAQLLLQKPGLLLLDEPTNHLDMDAVAWLEGYLKSWQGAVVLVSHDRWLLDQLCTHTAELHGGRADVYTGGYTSFIAQRQEKRRLQEKAYETNQKELDRQKKVVQQYYDWGRMNSRNFVKAKAREKMLEKMERVDRPERQRDKISLTLNASQRSGNDVLTAEDLEMAFDDNLLFSGLSIDLKKGDKAALIGQNGIGKTTLLRIIAEQLRPVSGSVTLGAGVTVGYYDQLQQTLDSDSIVLDELRGIAPQMSDGELRNVLAAFLFRGDDVFKRVAMLSGGEKGRLSLLKLMMGRDNLLLLDEPTNHLDMDSREVLEDALLHFDATVLFVSHDRYFMGKIATRVLEMTRETVTQFGGGWSEYLAFLEKQKTADEMPDLGLTKTEAAKQKRAIRDAELRQREAKKRLEKIEADIAALEDKLSEIEQTLADPAGISEDQLLALSQTHADVQVQIDALMTEWEQAHEAV